MSWVWLNGVEVEESSAVVPLGSGGFLHGAGLFETLRAESGKVFRWEGHLERLKRSAEAVLGGLDHQVLPSRADAEGLMRRCGLSEARLRLTVSAGAVRGEDADARDWTVALTASALAGYPAELYARGISTVISPYRQGPLDPLAGHKTTCYLPRLMALREAQRHGCGEAIWFTHEHLLAEGSISNVILVKDGGLLTPPLDTPVLAGMARGLVLSLAREAGLSVDEKPLTINDLLEADEVLLTNSIMQLMPVVKIERHDVGGGKVGEVGRRLLDGYREVVRRECGG